MRQELTDLANSYRQAGDAILEAIKASIQAAGGFVNCSNNKQEKPDIRALVFDGKKGYTETFPIRALRVTPEGKIEAYIGTFGTIYTDKYLREGKLADEHWMALKDSNILFYQTILSIAKHIDEYLPKG